MHAARESRKHAESRAIPRYARFAHVRNVCTRSTTARGIRVTPRGRPHGSTSAAIKMCVAVRARHAAC